VFVLEGEYTQALLAAERRFVADLLEEIEAGTLEGIAAWRAWSSAEQDKPATR
jgi:hypothetical protein